MADPKFPEKAKVGEYPFNKVTVWPDGRELHINYSPNNFTTRYLTHKGTGIEINNDGRLVNISASHSYNYSLGGQSSTSDLNTDAKSGGGNRTSNDKGSHTEDGGNKTTVSSGGSTSIAKEGTVSMSGSSEAKQETISKGDRSENIEGNVHVKVTGDKVYYINGNLIEKTSGEASLEVGGNRTTEIKGKYKLIIGDKLSIIANDIEIISNGKMLLQSAGEMTLKGSTIQLNP